MCLNPAFAAFVLFLPRDAQNRNKIKLFERALLLFQAAINGSHFIRSKIECCRSGLDQTGFYFLPIPKEKVSLLTHERECLLQRQHPHQFLQRCNIKYSVLWMLKQTRQVFSKNRQLLFFLMKIFSQEHYLHISLRKTKLGWGLRCSFKCHSLFW